MTYRTITTGEIVQQKDQWFDERDGCWEPTTSHTWGAPCPPDMVIRRLAE